MSKSFTIRRRKTAKGCVSQGARLLDIKRPGWEKTVNGAIVNKKFDMTNWDRCVAGTLEIYQNKYVDQDGYSFRDTVLAFNGLEFSTYDDRVRYIGFDLGPWTMPKNSGTDDAYEYLEQLWQAEVEKRLAKT